MIDFLIKNQDTIGDVLLLCLFIYVFDLVAKCIPEDNELL